MKYRFTPFNITIALLIAFVSYVAIRKNVDDNTVLGAAYVIPVIIVGAIIDLVFQIFIKTYQTLILVEATLILVVVFLNQI